MTLFVSSSSSLLHLCQILIQENPLYVEVQLPDLFLDFQISQCEFDAMDNHQHNKCTIFAKVLTAL